MLHRRELCVTPLGAEIDLSNARNVHEARLIHVQGCGALTERSYELPEDRDSLGDILSILTLNETPLLQMELPCCPTCAGLIAAGRGIENVNCAELEAISERINAPFESLEQSIRDLEPLLTLLKTGLYVIADAVCVPTDGDGSFFWAVQNEPTRHPATGMAVDMASDDYDYYDGQPLYLYPSQSAARFDAARVDYYKPRIMQPDAPRAVAYTVTDSLNLLLDGHHKAAAAAALHRPVPCLLILPMSGIEYSGKFGLSGKPKALLFHSVQVRADGLPNKMVKNLIADRKVDFTLSRQRIAPGKLIGRDWEDRFLRAGGHYPAMRELAQMLSTGCSFTEPVPEEWLQRHLAQPEREEAQRAIAGVIPIMELQADGRLRAIALQVAREFPPCRAQFFAYRALSRLKGDAEIEQLFVDYLVEHDDRHDALREIVNGYWDEE